MTQPGKSCKISHRNQPSGFTLVEILGVLVIVGLSTMVVTLSLTDATPHYRLQSAERKVKNALRNGQYQAISSGKPYVISYKTGSNTIKAFPSPSKQPPPTNFFRRTTISNSFSDNRTSGPTLDYTLAEGVNIGVVELQGTKRTEKTAKLTISRTGYFMPHKVSLKGEGDRKGSVLLHPFYKGTESSSDLQLFSRLKDRRPEPN